MNPPKCRKTPKRPRRRVSIASAPFYHVTPNYNLYGIDRKGLLVAFAVGKRKAVYLVTRRRINWAKEHVARRHNTSDTRLTVIGVQVGANLLVPMASGVYYCESDVPRNCLSGLPQRSA